MNLAAATKKIEKAGLKITSVSENNAATFYGFGFEGQPANGWFHIQKGEYNKGAACFHTTHKTYCDNLSQLIRLVAR